uniref:Reverse transcriptase RNase H-like domain-containing protein n=1 Tax=Vespula pensylvanica TaxID=30213 RepID=A0A834N2C2_VESPE|nr:hypothetical protein H0235_017448 [Vespula pensylvanica]
MVNRTAVVKWSHKWEHQTQSEEYSRRDYSLPSRYPAPPYKPQSNSKDSADTGHPVEFHIVPNSFCIPHGDIFESNHFKDSTKINFLEKILSWRGIVIPFVETEEKTIAGRTCDVFRRYDAHASKTQQLFPNSTFLARIHMKDDSGNLLYIDTPESLSLGQGKRATESIPDQHSVIGEQREILTQVKPLDSLNNEEREVAERMIKDSADLFHLSGDKLIFTKIVDHNIRTTDSIPVVEKQYRFLLIHKEINEQIDSLVLIITIRPSVSSYNSPLWIVLLRKRTRNEWKQKMEAHQLGSAKYFSTFDLTSGFHQIPMDENEAEETAFNMSKFRKLSDKIRRADLKLQPDKCNVRKKVAYWGHVISTTEVKLDPRKIRAAKQNYSTIEKKLLAIIYIVNHFRPYLYGTSFRLFTDHNPLIWLNSVKDPISGNPVEMSKQILSLVSSNTDNRHSEPRGSPTLTDAIKTLFKTHDNTDNDKSHDDSEITSEENYTHIDSPFIEI